MQAGRLMRLMRLMIELSRREFRSAEDIYQPLGISRSQFYRDKEALEKMGFAFTFQRRHGVFAVDHDPGVKLEGLTLSEVLALILAVERLPETGDFTLAYSALTALRKITVDNPGPAADFIEKSRGRRRGPGSIRRGFRASGNSGGYRKRKTPRASDLPAGWIAGTPFERGPRSPGVSRRPAFFGS